jgi:hypothetical protein
MAKPKEWRLEKGDHVEINGQMLMVLDVLERADGVKTFYLSDDYMLRISENRRELFKRSRLDPDREEITAVGLESIKTLK